MRTSIQKASLVTQMVKNLPAGQETQVRLLGQEDPLEKEMAIHSSILAWRIPWTEEPGRLQSMGSLLGKLTCVILDQVHNFFETPLFSFGKQK